MTIFSPAMSPPASTRRLKFSVAMGMLPLLALLVVLIADDARQSDALAQARVAAQTRSLVAALDHAFIRTQLVLDTLGQSDQLETSHFAQFHSRAQHTAKDLGAASIVLLSPDGKLQLSTRRTYGTPLPRLNAPPLLGRTFATGLPGISDLFINPIDQQFIYTLSVPIRRQGEIAYSLNAIFTPDALATLLSEQHLPADWRATIVDGQGKIVCRSHEAARFTGHVVPTKLAAKL